MSDKTGKIIAAMTSSLLLASTAISLPSHAEGFDPMGKLTKVSGSISDATDGRINISGYINGHYMVHKGMPEFVGKNLNDPLYQIREASLFIDTVVTDNILLSTEIEFSYDFTDEKTSGRSDPLKVNANYGYVEVDVASIADWDTDKWGGFDIRAGKVLVPFLSFNENKPNFRQYLMSTPFTAWQLAPVNNVAIGFDQFGWADFGATGSWTKMISDKGLFNIKASLINGLGSPTGQLDSNTVQLETSTMMKPVVVTRDGFFQNKNTEWETADNNDNYANVIKASFKLLSAPLDFGVSRYSGAWDDAGDQNLTMYGVHANYLERNFTLKGEWGIADVEQNAGVNNIPVMGPGMGPAMINMSTDDYQMSAWYVEGTWVAYRYGSNDDRFVRLVVRFDDVDTNDQAAFTPFDRSRYTLGTEWGFLNNTRLRYEYQRSTIHDFQNAPGPFLMSGGTENIDMHMISMIAYF